VVPGTGLDVQVAIPAVDFADAYRDASPDLLKFFRPKNFCAVGSIFPKISFGRWREGV
jgi:hypothetical protein